MAGWIDTRHEIDTFLFMQTVNSTGICHPDGCSECQNVATRLLVSLDPQNPDDCEHHNEIAGCVLRIDDNDRPIVFETPEGHVADIVVIKALDPTPSPP